MDIKHDEPKLTVDVHRKTTQLNLWMIVAIVLFFVLGGVWIYRVFRDPPKSTPEMQHGQLEQRTDRLAGDWAGTTASADGRAFSRQG